MSWTVAETFASVRPLLPEWLDSDAVDWCAQLTERVPSAASSHYLELRLTSGREIDFLTCSTDKRLAAQLQRQLQPNPSPVWQSNLAVLSEWARDGSELSHAPLVYLEYDAGARVINCEPEASLAVCVERNYQSRHWRPGDALDDHAVALGKRLYQRLAPHGHRELWSATLERCYAALPKGGAIPHVCVMSAREPVTAKPYVVLPRSSVLHFLREIEWPGSLDAVQELIATYYAAFREQVYLDLTITDSLQERLGVVTSQFQRRDVDFSSIDWWRLPAELEAQRAALQKWIGCSETTLGGERAWIHRWLDTKAVLCGGRIDYKAYLGFSAVRPPLFC